MKKFIIINLSELNTSSFNKNKHMIYKYMK